MTSTTHIGMGFVGMVVVAEKLYLTIPTTLIGMVFSAVAAILPDIDTPQSYLGKRIPILAYLIRLSGIRHRTLTHTLWSVLAVVVLMAMAIYEQWVYPPYAISILVGYSTHILADLLTSEGVEVFWPISHARLKLIDVVPTGGLGDRMIGCMCYAVTICYIYYRV